MSDQPRVINLQELYEKCQKENLQIVEDADKNNIIMNLIQTLSQCQEQLKAYQDLHAALDEAPDAD